MTSLKSEIRALETEFLAIHKEIEAIERGDWDEKFQIQLGEQQARPVVVTQESVEVPKTPTKEEEIGKPETPPSGNKRTREGKKKDESASSTPADASEEHGEEEQEEEEPPAKRSRRSTEEVQTEEPAVEEEKVEEPTTEEQPMEEVVPEEVEHPMEPTMAEEEPPQPEEEQTKPTSPDGETIEPGAEEIETERQLEQEEQEEPDLESKPENPSPEILPDQSEQPEPIISPIIKPELSEPESDGPYSPSHFPAKTDFCVAETTPSRPKQRPFNILIHPLHSSISSLKSAALFSQPIRETEAPGYSKLVYKPVDLKTLWKQVKEGIVTDSVVYHREVARMFANAIMYNDEDCIPLFLELF